MTAPSRKGRYRARPVAVKRKAASSSKAAAAKSPMRLTATNAELARELQALGFSEYEARTYIALLQSSPATAYEIAKLAGLPRANTYGALDNCTKKGAVQPFSQSPVRYIPVDPRALMSRIESDISLRCKQLASRLGHMKLDDSRDFVWTIDGEPKVSAKITEMIQEAKIHIWIKAHAGLIDLHYADLRAAAERGVSILIILFGHDANRFRFGTNVNVYLHEGNGVRIGNADNLFTITTDFETALTANMLGEVQAAHTRNRSIVTMAESLLRHDMYLAEIFDRFGPQIDEAFGPFLGSLRRRYFSPQQLLTLNEIQADLVAKSREKGAQVRP